MNIYYQGGGKPASHLTIHLDMYAIDGDIVSGQIPKMSR